METIFISPVDQLLEGGGSFVRQAGVDKTSCKEGGGLEPQRKVITTCGAGRQRDRDLQWAEPRVSLVTCYPHGNGGACTVDTGDWSLRVTSDTDSGGM